MVRWLIVLGLLEKRDSMFIVRDHRVSGSKVAQLAVAVAQIEPCSPMLPKA